MIDRYLYFLTDMVCLLCDRRHLKAFETLSSGTVTAGSPQAAGCYACQLAGMTPDERLAAKDRFSKIWRYTTTEPLPKELQQ